MTDVLAIDPGNTESGYAWYVGGVVCASGVLANAEIIGMLPAWRLAVPSAPLAIEMIASYGMAVGKEVLETVRWIGRFQQAWPEPESVRLVYRKDVKLHLCGSLRAKDANIRQALIDMLGPQGNKKAPGPTYGIKSHAWSALAVAVTAANELQREAA